MAAISLHAAAAAAQEVDPFNPGEGPEGSTGNIFQQPTGGGGKTTSVPVPNNPDFDWNLGSGRGGLFNQKRITVYDKIRESDINQLRAHLEALAAHHHAYEDRKGC